MRPVRFTVMRPTLRHGCRGYPGHIEVQRQIPGHIEVQRQITGLFVAEERGSHELKGVPEPVTLFRLIRASGGGRRAGQRHLHEVSRLCCSCRARLVASTGRPYEAVAVASMLGQKEARLFVFRSMPRR